MSRKIIVFVEQVTVISSFPVLIDSLIFLREKFESEEKLTFLFPVDTITTWSNDRRKKTAFNAFYAKNPSGKKRILWILLNPLGFIGFFWIKSRENLDLLRCFEILRFERIQVSAFFPLEKSCQRVKGIAFDAVIAFFFKKLSGSRLC